MNETIKDYLLFKKWVTPVIIQVLFWLGVAFCVIGGLIMLIMGGAQGILVILLGPIFVRIYAELVLVIFRIHDFVQAIAQKKTESGPSA